MVRESRRRFIAALTKWCRKVERRPARAGHVGKIPGTNKALHWCLSRFLVLLPNRRLECFRLCEVNGNFWQDLCNPAATNQLPAGSLPPLYRLLHDKVAANGLAHVHTHPVALTDIDALPELPA